MKKYSVLIALAALAIFASCEKNPEGAREQTAADPVFTATIVNTKTTVNTSDGKVAWDGDEEITITDAASTSVVYEVSSVTDGRATFTKKAGESGSLGAGPYTAVYGTAPLAAQVYGADVTDLPMTASSATTSLTFSVNCGLLEVVLTKAGESISSVAVSDGVNTYTLSCASPLDIASGETFRIALPAGNYTSFSFTNSNGGVCRKSGGTVSLAANQIQPISFSSMAFTYIVHDATELYAAISACQDGDKIMLAEGTYTATETFAITKNITLEGGYGASPALGDVPAPQTYKATLDGADTYRVMSINAIVAAGKSVKLSGLVLQNGKNADANAGGMIIEKGTVMIDYVDILDNKAKMGAGFLVTGTNTTASFSNCLISGNAASGNHANYVYAGASVSLDKCVFRGNSASQGGGLTVYNNNAQSVSIKITNSEFSNNSASTYGGAICLRGDGSTSGVTLYVANSTFYGNTSGTWGSAIAVFGASTKTATADIYSCTVTGNTASGTYGAVVRYNAYTTVNIYNSIVLGNTCSSAPEKADLAGTITSENTVSSDTVSDYLATSASSNAGYITKAYKVKTAATTAGMNAATLATKYTGGDSEFAAALAVDQWGASRAASTTAGACITADE